nr:phospholipase-like protein [Tanacetum cinerariifolium]
DGLFDSEADCRNSKEDNENQLANVSIRNLYAVFKVHKERISNLEILLKEKLPNDYAAENTKPNMIPNHSDDISSCFILDLISNQIGSICSRTDMYNAEIGCDGMAIDKPDQRNDYNCSQPIPASMDALIQAYAYAADHPKLDVLRHKAHVDRLGPKINQHPTAEPLTEMIPNVSLDDMKFQHEKENFPVKDTPLEHQPVDELINAQKDTTNLLPENVKDEINKSKSIQEQKKMLAMALGSPYGQLGTTTPALPKTRSMTSIVDTIVAPEFEVEISRQPKIRSLNELMTLQVFVKVYFLVNEPERHWCLAELQISTGVVTFYDTLSWVKRNKRPWWRNMKRNLPLQLTSYLNEHGVLASKGLSVEQYEIKYAFPNVFRQADDSGDYGVWV